MEKSHDCRPGLDIAQTFALKQRLVTRAGEPGAVGELGRLLRDAKDLTELETDTQILAMADVLHDQYGQLAVIGLIADLQPLKSIWLEIVFEEEGERMGLLCLGAGAGTLELYVAYVEAGDIVSVEVVAGMRRQTKWRPSVDWAKMADGTWVPSSAWSRRAKTWFDAHFWIRDLQLDMTLRTRAEASYAMFPAFMALALMHSPSFGPGYHRAMA